MRPSTRGPGSLCLSLIDRPASRLAAPWYLVLFYFISRCSCSPINFLFKSFPSRLDRWLSCGVGPHPPVPDRRCPVRETRDDGAKLCGLSTTSPYTITGPSFPLGPVRCIAPRVPCPARSRPLARTAGPPTRRRGGRGRWCRSETKPFERCSDCPIITHSIMTLEQRRNTRKHRSPSTMGCG